MVDGPHVHSAETAATVASLSPPAALPRRSGGGGEGPWIRSPSFLPPQLTASPQPAADRGDTPPPHVAAEPPPPAAARRRSPAACRRRPRPIGTSPH